MELVLVRHGEPAWLVEGRPQNDPALTARGHEQARRVAERLARGRPARGLLVSSARRAQETAAPVAEALNLVPERVEVFHELRGPDLSDVPKERLAELFLTLRSRPVDAWWDGWPGGESFRDFHARVVAALTSLLAERGVSPLPGQPAHLWQVPEAVEEERLVVVSHGGTSAVILSYLLGIAPTPWEWERFALGHGAIARLKTVPLGGAHVFSLRACNDQEHIERALRSG